MTRFVTSMLYSVFISLNEQLGNKMSLKSYAVGAAALLMPLSAWAADTPQKQGPAKVPVMAQASNSGMGYYVEGQLGATSVWDLDTATYSGAVGGITYTNTKASFAYQPAFSYGVEAGLRNVGGMPVRIGLAYQGFAAKVDKVTGSGSFTYNGTTYHLSQTVARAQLSSAGLDFDNQVHLFFANAYYDFNSGSAFRPFIGAGIGLANIEHAKNNELALNASVGAQYDLTSTVYVGGKLQLSWVNGPKDKLGVSYNNVMATTGMMSLGVKF